MYYVWGNFCSCNENSFNMWKNHFSFQRFCHGMQNKGQTVRESVIDLLSLLDSQMKLPIGH